MPGIATTSGPCASTQASVSCAGVQPFSLAIASILATSARFCSKFCLLKARMRRASAIDIGKRLDRAGQESTTQRRIGDEADAQRPRRLARLFRFSAVQQRILGLHRRDRMHRMRAP